MKKYLLAILAVVMSLILVVVFSACADNSEGGKESDTDAETLDISLGGDGVGTGEQMGGDGNKKPDDDDQTPDGGNQTPDGGDQTPDGGDQTPDGGDQTPDGGDQTPDGGDQTPEDDKTITNGNGNAEGNWGDYEGFDR